MTLLRSGLAGLMALALTTAAPALAQETVVASAAPADVMVLTDQDRIMGQMSAPVTVIEYASFTCSHCANWWVNVSPEFKSRFVDTGRVRLVMRDLPTPPQEFSWPAAILARCAAPERFFDVFGVLITYGYVISNDDDAALWLTMAGQAGGMAIEDIVACFEDPMNAQALESRIAASHSMGVNSTPTFFVNGQRMEATDLDSFETVIAAQEAALGVVRAVPTGAP